MNNVNKSNKENNKMKIFINIDDEFDEFPGYYKEVDIDQACNLSFADKNGCKEK